MGVPKDVFEKENQKYSLLQYEVVDGEKRGTLRKIEESSQACSVRLEYQRKSSFPSRIYLCTFCWALFARRLGQGTI